MEIYFKDFLGNPSSKGKITSAFSSRIATDGGEPDKLISLITLSGIKQGDELSRLTRFVWSKVVEEYTYFEGTRLEAVKSGLATAPETVKLITRNDKDIIEDIDLNIVLIAVAGEKIYFGVLGDHSFYVVHEGSCVDLTEILRQNSINAGSLILADVDLGIMCSGDLLKESVSSFEERPYEEIARDLSERKVPEGAGILMFSPRLELEQLIATKESVSPEPSQESTPENDVVDVDLETTQLVNEVEDSSEKIAPTEQFEDLSDMEMGELEATPVQPEKRDISKVSTPLPTSRLRSVQFGERAEKAKEIGGKLLDITEQIVEKIGQVVGLIWAKLVSIVTALLSGRFGRNPTFKRYMARLSQMRFGRSSGVRGMKIGAFREKSLRNRRVALLLISLLVIFGLFMGIRKAQDIRAAKELHDRFTATYLDIEENLDSASSKSTSDQEASELALAAAKRAREEIDYKDQLETDDLEKFNSIDDRIVQIEDKLNKVTVLSEDKGNIELFLDAKISFDDSSRPADLVLFKNSQGSEELYITDPGSKSVYRVGIESKNVSKLLDESNLLMEPTFVDIGNEGVYIYDKRNGVLKAPFGDNDTILRNVSTLSGLTAQDLSNYNVNEFAILTASDNVYLLDLKGGSIIKSNRLQSGYGLPFTYFADPALRSGTDFFADFSIYALYTGENGLMRLQFDNIAGELVPNPVSITALRDSLEDPTAGYTGFDLSSDLFLFDAQGQRIVRLEKPDEATQKHPGQMLHTVTYQYRGNKGEVFDDVKDIVVDSQQGMMYILSGNRIWKVTL